MFYLLYSLYGKKSYLLLVGILLLLLPTLKYDKYGSGKMIESIKKMHHRYVILDKHDYNADFDNQFDLKIANYIINNTKYIKTERYFDIYYLE